MSYETAMNPAILTLTALILCLARTVLPFDPEEELSNSIDRAMACRGGRPPEGPVMAISPKRFVQVVVVLHRRFGTSGCGLRPNKPLNVSDEKTWPFCVFGRCKNNVCQCAGTFVGSKCATMTQKCWLMYCFLTSCHPIHQSLHCLCDPSLYGTKVTTGIYWYNEGKSAKFKPPPEGWKDDVTSLIGSSAIKAESNKQFVSSDRRPPYQGFREGVKPGQFQPNNRLGVPSKNQRPGFGLPNRLPIAGSNGQPSVLNPNQQQSKTGSSQQLASPAPNQLPAGSGAAASGPGAKAAEAAEKTDVEEALQQLDEAPAAASVTCAELPVVLMAIFSLQYFALHLVPLQF